MLSLFLPVAYAQTQIQILNLQTFDTYFSDIVKPAVTWGWSDFGHNASGSLSMKVIMPEGKTYCTSHICFEHDSIGQYFFPQRQIWYSNQLGNLLEYTQSFSFMVKSINWPALDDTIEIPFVGTRALTGWTHYYANAPLGSTTNYIYIGIIHEKISTGVYDDYGYIKVYDLVGGKPIVIYSQSLSSFQGKWHTVDIQVNNGADQLVAVYFDGVKIPAPYAGWDFPLPTSSVKVDMSGLWLGILNNPPNISTTEVLLDDVVARAGFYVTQTTTTTTTTTMPCSEGSTKCVGTDLYQCSAGQWVLKESNSATCPTTPIPNILPIVLIAAGVGAVYLASRRRKKK